MTNLTVTCHKCGRQTTMAQCPGCGHWMQDCKKCNPKGAKKPERKGVNGSRRG